MARASAEAMIDADVQRCLIVVVRHRRALDLIANAAIDIGESGQWRRERRANPSLPRRSRLRVVDRPRPVNACAESQDRRQAVGPNDAPPVSGIVLQAREIGYDVTR